AQTLLLMLFSFGREAARDYRHASSRPSNKKKEAAWKRPIRDASRSSRNSCRLGAMVGSGRKFELTSKLLDIRPDGYPPFDRREIARNSAAALACPTRSRLQENAEISPGNRRATLHRRARIPVPFRQRPPLTIRPRAR